jgi:hypothetical protein
VAADLGFGGIDQFYEARNFSGSGLFVNDTLF